MKLQNTNTLQIGLSGIGSDGFYPKRVGLEFLSDGNPKGGFASEGQCDDACQRAYGRPISSSNRSPLIQNYPMGVFLCALAFTSLLWLSDNIRCL